MPSEPNPKATELRLILEERERLEVEMSVVYGDLSDERERVLIEQGLSTLWVHRDLYSRRQARCVGLGCWN